MNSCVVLSFCLIFGLTEAQGICNGNPCVFRGQICDGSKCRCPKGMKPMGNSCDFPPPPGPPKTPTEEEKQNSVLIEILKTNKSEWDMIVNDRFRNYIADYLTHEYCINNQGRCGLPHELEERMNKYFNGTYLSRQAHRLPGYPEQKGQDLLIAFYILNPPGYGADKVIPAAVVVEILDRTLVTEWIKVQLDGPKKLGKVRVISESWPNSASSISWQWSVVGVVIIVLTLGVSSPLGLLCA